MKDFIKAAFHYPYISFAQFNRINEWFDLTGAEQEKLVKMLVVDAGVIISEIYNSDLSPAVMKKFKIQLIGVLGELSEGI